MKMLQLRRATPADAEQLTQWDADPDVISATTDDNEPGARAFGGVDWREELAQDADHSYHLIAELEGRAIGAMQIIDPHLEPSHYWGEIEPHQRAVDIWIGAAADRGRGYGAEMMRLAHELCFGDPAVSAIVIDPLATNVRALRFYARIGYEAVGPRMFGDDACMVLRLTRERFEALRRD